MLLNSLVTSIFFKWSYPNASIVFGINYQKVWIDQTTRQLETTTQSDWWNWFDWTSQLELSGKFLNQTVHSVRWTLTTYEKLSKVNALVWRQFKRMVRDPLAVRAKLIECILIAVFYGIMFYRTPNYFTNPEDFQYTWDQVMDINVSSSKTYIVEFFF